MEYGLSSDLTLYSGGLGILAGDHMKAVGDLKAPLVGVGLLWDQGYCRQRVRPDGQIENEYPPTPRTDLERVDVKIEVSVDGKQVPCDAYRVLRHTKAELFLLEPGNASDRWITRRLYGGTQKDRIAQEMLLGIGGVRLLRALQRNIDVYHFNEGHAVFAGHELLCEHMAKGSSFQEAQVAVRQQVVFTTHTPVPAGNETHLHDDIVQMGANLELTRTQLHHIGGTPFSMTVAGLRLARIANGVAKLHASTARKMWKDVSDAAPIIAITNGVHRNTWQDARIRAAFESKTSDTHTAETLWSVHQQLKTELVRNIADRVGPQLSVDKPLIGFARRAATYKRSNLILSDTADLEALFRDHSVQLVFSGKAHPQDAAGRETVKVLIDAAKKWPNQVVFVPDYDMEWGALLTRGCDIWLNNPIRPKEACGTSGMKAAMNGVLNLSIADGWWPEGGKDGQNGWIIEPPATKPVSLDEYDRSQIVRRLSGEILPCYHSDRARWIQMMIASIQMSEEAFSAQRMVREYYQRAYQA